MKNFTRFCLLPAFFVLWSGLQVLLAQPSNDNCSTATPVGTLPWTSAAIDVTLATTTGDPTAPTCQTSVNRSIWFTLTPAVSGNYYISTCQSDAAGSTLPDIVLGLYTSSGGCAGTFTEVTCDDDACSTLNLQSVIAAANLTAGTTYYIVAWQYCLSGCTAPSVGSSNIQLYVAPPPTAPANDECVGATSLSVSGTTCTTSLASQTTAGATTSAGVPVGTCTGTPDDDVWYSFMATSATHTVTLSSVTPSNTMIIQLLSGSCGAWTSVNCGSAGTLTTSGLTPGTTYYVRVYTSAASAASGFTICVTTPPPPPSNDECAGALPFSVSPFSGCSYTNINTTGGTMSTAPTSSCFSSSNNDDVFYTFTTTTAGSYTFSYQNFVQTSGTATQVALQLYSGLSCGALTEIVAVCNLGYGSAGSGTVSYTLLASTNYYLRICTAGSANSASFDFCIKAPPPPPANDECAGATAFSTSTFGGCAYTAVTTAGATQSTPNPSCTSTGNDDDVWYTLTPAVSGSYTIRYNTLVAATGTASTVGYDLYTGSCGSLTAVGSACNTGFGSSGSGTVSTPTLTAGTIYYLRVWVGSATNSGSWNMCIEEPAPMTYVSSAITQQTGTTPAGSVYQKILRLDVVVIGSASPLSVTQLNFSTAGTPGTSNVADLTNARVYWTGTTSTFTDGSPAGTQFGSVIANPSGTMTFSGAQALTGAASNTTNYFWLVYDLSCGAVGPNIDASMLTNGLALSSGGPYTPTTPDPASNRTVTALSSWSTANNGNWSTPGTWLCGVPTANTTLPININHNVVLDINVDMQSTLTLAAAKTLNLSANTLTIGGAGTGAQNLAVNGTINLSGAATLNVGTAASGTVTSGSVTVASGGAINVTGGTFNVGTGLVANVTTGNITINSGGALTASGGTINLGPTGGYNRTLSVTGTATFGGSNVNVNGSAVFNSNSTFNMSGGNFNIDGTGAASVPSGTSLLRFGSSSTGMTINATGGTITIVDPHASSSASNYAVIISISSSNVPTTSFAGCTFQFGDGASSTAGNTSGFIFDTYFSTKNVPLGNLIVNGGSGATRFTSGTAVGGDASDIYGTLNVNSGSELRTASSDGIGVYGNIVNDGTISVTSASSGILYLGGKQVGSAPAATFVQTISGGGVWRNSTTSSTASVNSLTMNNGGGTTLQVPLTVGNTLTLTNGKIFTDASNYIGVGTGLLPAGTPATGTVSPTTTTNVSHIVGPIRRALPGGATTWLATDQRGLFPVGDGTTARQLNIALTTASTAGSLSGRFQAMDPGNPPTPYADGGITIDATSPTGYWNVEYANGASGGGYTVQGNATGFTKRSGGAITLLTGIRLIKRTTGGSWVAGADGTAAAPSLISAVSRTMVSTFSDFAIGGTAAALPLELAYFTGQAQANTNLLTWETRTEKNVQSHIVERSVDGVNWTEIGRKAGQALSVEPLKYTLEDRAPLAKAYYRLRSVDFDGQESKSNAILLTRRGEHFGITSVFPSPTVDNVTVQFVSLTEETVTVRVLDLTGRQVLAQNIDALKDVNELLIPLNGLQAGVYTVTVANSAGVSTPVRFVKQ